MLLSILLLLLLLLCPYGVQSDDVVIFDQPEPNRS